MDWASYLLYSIPRTFINHPSSVWRHYKRKNYTHHYFIGNTVIFKNKKAKLLFQKLILELQFLQSLSPHG